MPKYRFLITRDVTQSVMCTVEAPYVSNAYHMACEDPDKYAEKDAGGAVNWQIDDGSQCEPYIADEHDYEEVQWRYDNPHPEFTIESWKFEVWNGDTVLGYHEWVEHRREEAINDSAADR